MMHLGVVAAEVAIACVEVVATVVQEIEILRVANTVGGHDRTAIHTEIFRIELPGREHLRVERKMIVEPFEMPRTRMIEEMDAVRIEQNLAEINRLLVGVVDVDGMILDAEVGANALLGFAHGVERVSFEDKAAHRSGLAEAGV